MGAIAASASATSPLQGQSHRSGFNFQLLSNNGSTTATVAGVPPGRFYVRVRGGNAFGGGRPSAEAVVTVP